MALVNRCVRCKAPLTAWTMSKFNEDEICLECWQDEKLAPGYAKADEAEAAAVKKRNYNFPGIGLDPASKAFLVQRIRDRREALRAKAKAHAEETA